MEPIPLGHHHQFHHYLPKVRIPTSFTLVLSLSFIFFLYLSTSAYCRLTTIEMETGRVDQHRSGRPAGRVTGRSRFFDRPVKPVEAPFKFFFIATNRHLSSNRNIHKNCINKPHLLKTVVEWFQAVTYML